MPDAISPCWLFNEVSALAANTGAEPPEEPHVRALFRLLRGQDADDVGVGAAYTIFRSPYRHVMDALSLCAARDVEVESALELKPGVYAVYRKLFFDRRVFTSVFDMRMYVQRLRLSEEERDIYNLAFQEGANRLLDRYRVAPRPAPDPQIVLEDMLGEAHSRAFEHRGRPITSKVAAESFKWGRAAASTALAMKQAMSSNRMVNALEQLEFALTSDDQTKAPEDLGLNPNDILKG
jgi:hypothetical protein